eukprot:7250630-Prymnesium_polylepis.1
MSSTRNGRCTPGMTNGSATRKKLSSSRLVPMMTLIGAPDGERLILPWRKSSYGTSGSPCVLPSTTAAKPTSGAIGGRTLGQHGPPPDEPLRTASSRAARAATRRSHSSTAGGALAGSRLVLHQGFGGEACAAAAERGQSHSFV